MSEPIRLTQYSHGAGCGCKISPQVLDVILAGSGAQHLDPRLWVGNASSMAFTMASTCANRDMVMSAGIACCRPDLCVRM